MMFVYLRVRILSYGDNLLCSTGTDGSSFLGLLWGQTDQTTRSGSIILICGARGFGCCLRKHSQTGSLLFLFHGAPLLDADLPHMIVDAIFKTMSTYEGQFQGVHTIVILYIDCVRSFHEEHLDCRWAWFGVRGMVTPFPVYSWGPVCIDTAVERCFGGREKK